MSLFGFLSGGQSQQVPVPQYTGVQIQSSSSALPIPIVWGTNALAPNIIFTGAFKAEPVYSGGSHPTITGYNYTQNLIFGLCEGGPAGIARIGLFYAGDDFYAFADNATLANGAVPPALPSGPDFVNAARKMAYAGTAYAYANDYDLGASASTGTITLEVHGIFDATAGTNKFDADPALVVQDFLTKPTYGCGLPASALDLAALLSPPSGPDRSYQGYCRASELGFSPALVSTESGSSILTRWLQLTNSAPIWSGGKLKIIPYGDTAIDRSPRLGTLSQPIPAGDGSTVDGSPYPNTRVNFGFISDNGVINQATGAPLRKVSTTAGLSASGTYYVSTAFPGRYVFSPNDAGLPVTLTFTYAPIASFSPMLVPLYDLTDDDFVDDGAGDPVVVTRSDASELDNVVRLEICDRFNFYSPTTIEARDQSAIERYGSRPASVLAAHEITNAQTGQIAAQLILQRGLGVRNTYAFKLSWEYILLEPMDIVTLTDTALGLSMAPARIVSIEEDEQGLLDVTAEEMAPGIGTAVAYATGGSAGGVPGASTTPAPIEPTIFEAPSQIANNSIEIIFGATSSLGGLPDPSYGGCNIMVSYDGGATYLNLAKFMGQSTRGVLTAPLPAFTGVNPDTADTLAIDLSKSGGALDAGSQSAAQGLQTLVLVDGELVAYGAASGTPGGTYALTYLERGVYGSGSGAHASGAPFLDLNGLVATAVLPNKAKGTTVLFKFQGFNPFGKGLQDLASCTPWPQVITGAGLS